MYQPPSGTSFESNVGALISSYNSSVTSWTGNGVDVVEAGEPLGLGWEFAPVWSLAALLVGPPVAGPLSACTFSGDEVSFVDVVGGLDALLLAAIL